MESPSAVITHCQHYFHKHCLKKWLIVQDNCPLCTKPIVAAATEDNSDNVIVEPSPVVEPVEDVVADSPDQDNNENEIVMDKNVDNPNSLSPELRYRGRAASDNNVDLFEGD